jgi:hypothetical protein
LRNCPGPRLQVATRALSFPSCRAHVNTATSTDNQPELLRVAPPFLMLVLCRLFCKPFELGKGRLQCHQKSNPFESNTAKFWPGRQKAKRGAEDSSIVSNSILAIPSRVCMTDPVSLYIHITGPFSCASISRYFSSMHLRL